MEKQTKPLCGIDEAGRGPLAGSLVIAGVVLKNPVEGLMDSKKLSEKRREALYPKIIAASEYHIAVFTHTQIDEKGISGCLHDGLEQIKASLSESNYLFDGNSTFGVEGIETMVKADAKVPEVSAASILAKVTRDRVMKDYAMDYPEYGFDPSAYAEFARVKERHVRTDVIHLPDNIPFEVGALIEPLATMWRLMNRANIKGGDTVLILGAGFLGLSAVQVAQRQGACMVISCDYNDWKLKYAKDLGADMIINRGKFTIKEIAEKIREANEGRLADVVIVVPPKLSALEEGDRLDLDRIRKELVEREGKVVPIETIRDVLIKLSRGDLLQYMELGGWFRKIDDPILLEFLKVWGRIEVEGHDRARVQKELVRHYQTLDKRINDHLGYLAEVYMAQVLWNGQRKTLAGRFFHSNEDVTLPWRFIYIRHRTRLGAAKEMEIDIEAAAAKEHWICENKWWHGRKVGHADVESLLRKAEALREAEGEGLETMRVWFFAHDGFTEKAKGLMKKKDVLWSVRDDLDGLLESVGLRRLPNI